MKEQILLNGITNDIAPTLLAGYYKYGVATLITGNFGTSGGAILEIETMQELINTDSNGNAKAILPPRNTVVISNNFFIKTSTYLILNVTFATDVIFFSILDVSLIPISETFVESTGVIWNTPIFTD